MIDPSRIARLGDPRDPSITHIDPFALMREGITELVWRPPLIKGGSDNLLIHTPDIPPRPGENPLMHQRRRLGYQLDFIDSSHRDGRIDLVTLALAAAQAIDYTLS